MHDTVGVVNGHGAILTEAAPLECCAERSDLDLLVLLLPGKFHKHLQNAEAGLACSFQKRTDGRARADRFTYLLQGRLGEVVLFKVKRFFG